MAKIERIERQKRIYRKRIPYGMQNFEDVMERDCYYVDKTNWSMLEFTLVML